jgi:hypothetical protein
MKRGDYIRLRVLSSEYEWTEGFVELVSENGRSVLVMLAGLVCLPQGGYISGVIPLLIDHDKGTCTGAVDGNEYEVEIKA